MVIDTSAVCAIMLGEDDAEQFARAVSDDPRRLMSAFSSLEAAIVPLTSDQYELAREAWRKYGKGRHPAGLNIGDCCSVARRAATSYGVIIHVPKRQALRCSGLR